MLGFLGKLFKGKNGAGPLTEVADIVDRFVDTKEDKREFFKEVYQMQAEDRASARNLYAKDSAVQKVYAIIYLVAYIGLTGFMIYWAFNYSTVQITDFMQVTISTTFGAMSAKVSTVTDFFFGASETRDEAPKTLFEAKKKN